MIIMMSEYQVRKFVWRNQISQRSVTMIRRSGIFQIISDLLSDWGTKNGPQIDIRSEKPHAGLNKYVDGMVSINLIKAIDNRICFLAVKFCWNIAVTLKWFFRTWTVFNFCYTFCHVYALSSSQDYGCWERPWEYELNWNNKEITLFPLSLQFKKNKFWTFKHSFKQLFYFFYSNFPAFQFHLQLFLLPQFIFN